MAYRVVFFSWMTRYSFWISKSDISALHVNFYFIFFTCKLLKVLSNLHSLLNIPDGSDGRKFSCSAGDMGSVLGLGRTPGEGHDNPRQCSCLGNPMDRGAWRATVRGVSESGMTERLHIRTFTPNIYRNELFSHVFGSWPT